MRVKYDILLCGAVEVGRIFLSGIFCRKFSGLQKTHPDHIQVVSETGPAQILVRCHIKCVITDGKTNRQTNGWIDG